MTQSGDAVIIGEASRLSGVSAKMIRHYEAIGLVPPADRKTSGYRLYRAEDVHTLRFIGRARSLGFSIAVIAELLALWRDHTRSNADVRRLAHRHTAELRRKMAGLAGLATALDHLVDACAGDGRPDCPILDKLAELKEYPCPAHKSLSCLPCDWLCHVGRRASPDGRNHGRMRCAVKELLGGMRVASHPISQ